MQESEENIQPVPNVSAEITNHFNDTAEFMLWKRSVHDHIQPTVYHYYYYDDGFLYWDGDMKPDSSRTFIYFLIVFILVALI